MAYLGIFEVADTVYFGAGQNDADGNAADGAAPTYDIRLAGAAAAAVPVASGVLVLLSDASYPAGCYEGSWDSTAATPGQYFVFMQGDPEGDASVSPVAIHNFELLAADTKATSLIGTPVALDGGTATLSGMMTKLADDNGGADFDAVTDSQEKIANAITAAAPIVYTPDASSVITTGTQDAGTWASTATINEVWWAIGDSNDAGATIDVTCEINMGADRVASEVNITGYYNRAGVGAYVVEMYVWNYISGAWDKLSQGSLTTEMRDRAANANYVFRLSAPHTDQITSVGEVKIRFASTRTTTQNGDVLYLDYVGVSGQATAALTPDAIAVAVHQELDDHLDHILLYTGDTRYVMPTGDDINSGHTPNDAFLTIVAAKAASAAGDRIVIGAGTYDEAGIDVSLDGLELHCEFGAILSDTTPGTVLTVSGDYCKVEGVEIQASAGQIGANITGNYSKIDDCYVHDGGATGWKIDNTATHAIMRRCRADDYSATGFDVGGAETLLHQCFALGSGGATRGFYLSHANADKCLLFSCKSLDNGTAGYEIVSGADNNIVHVSASGDGDGAYADAGTDNLWAGLISSDIQPVNTTQIEGADPTDTIRDSILDDATRFSGADIAAILVDTGTTIPTQISALNNLSIANVETALANYDAATGTNVTASTATIVAAIGALNNPTVAAIADAVLDEALSDHETAGTTAAALAVLWNDWSFPTASSWIVYKSDGSTVFKTWTLAGDGTTNFSRTTA